MFVTKFEIGLFGKISIFRLDRESIPPKPDILLSLKLSSSKHS